MLNRPTFCSRCLLTTTKIVFMVDQLEDFMKPNLRVSSMALLAACGTFFASCSSNSTSSPESLATGLRFKFLNCAIGHQVLTLDLITDSKKKILGVDGFVTGNERKFTIDFKVAQVLTDGDIQFALIPGKISGQIDVSSLNVSLLKENPGATIHVTGSRGFSFENCTVSNQSILKQNAIID